MNLRKVNSTKKMLKPMLTKKANMVALPWNTRKIFIKNSLEKRIFERLSLNEKQEREIYIKTKITIINLNAKRKQSITWQIEIVESAPYSSPNNNELRMLWLH